MTLTAMEQELEQLECERGRCRRRARVLRESADRQDQEANQLQMRINRLRRLIKEGKDEEEAEW